MRKKIDVALCLFFSFSVLMFSVVSADAAYFKPDVRPGYGVTSSGFLSDYFSSIKKTNMDTPVYILDSGKPGATMLLMGGTHPRELAGAVAATVMIENASVTRGKLIVIPCTNASAMSVKDTNGIVPHYLPIKTRSGMRFLTYGDRRTDILDQGVDDPDKFVHPSGFSLKNGAEARNLNRAYPGDPDGTPTQKLAFAIMELIRKEKVDFNLDLHESGTPDYHIDRKNGEVKRGSRLAYMLICNPKAVEIGATAFFGLEEKGISLRLDQSNPSFRGLSHYEIGKITECSSFLSETPNPGQDEWREVPDVINDPVYPLKKRVGTDLEIIRFLAESYGELMEKEIIIDNIPLYKDMIKKGVGAFLN